jgi:hypothetical protein
MAANGCNPAVVLSDREQSEEIVGNGNGPSAENLTKPQSIV